MTTTMAANLTCYTQIESPLGPLLLDGEDSQGLRQIEFVRERNGLTGPEWREDAALFAIPSASCEPISLVSLKPSISRSLPRAPLFS